MADGFTTKRIGQLGAAAEVLAEDMVIIQRAGDGPALKVPLSMVIAILGASKLNTDGTGAPDYGALRDNLGLSMPWALGNAVRDNDLSLVKFKHGEGNFPPENLDYLWPTGQNFWHAVIYKEFTALELPGAADTAPGAAFVTFAMANGCAPDVLAHMNIVGADAPDSSIFCFNSIAYTNAGAIRTRVRVGELDWQPNPDDDCTGFILAINTFGGPNSGQGFIFGGFGDSSLSNGILAGGIYDTGPFLVGNSFGETMGALVLSNSATTYTTDFIVASSGHAMRFEGSDGSHARIRNNAGFLIIKKGPQALVVQNNAASATVFAIDDVGAQAVGQAAVLGSAYTQHVAAFGNIEGSEIVKHTAANGTLSVSTFVATGTDGNAAASAVRVRANATTGRSGSIGGSWNVAGADYAEYERLGDDLLASGVVIRAGDIIGFDFDGRITNRFAEALRFGVKSTNPNLVGGDDWHAALGPEPARPVYPVVEYSGAADPGSVEPDHVTEKEVADVYGGLEQRLETAMEKVIPAWRDAGKSDAEIHDLAERQKAVLRKNWTAKADKLASMVGARDAYFDGLAAWMSDMDAYEASEAARKASFEAGPLAEWQAKQAAFELRLNTERKKWDRIAYCGKVPVNVTGATPGQWIVPLEGPDGEIVGSICDDSDLTFANVKRGAWMVGRVLDDGRAEVVV